MAPVVKAKTTMTRACLYGKEVSFKTSLPGVYPSAGTQKVHCHRAEVRLRSETGTRSGGTAEKFKVEALDEY